MSDTNDNKYKNKEIATGIIAIVVSVVLSVSSSLITDSYKNGLRDNKIENLEKNVSDLQIEQTKFKETFTDKMHTVDLQLQKVVISNEATDKMIRALIEQELKKDPDLIIKSYENTK